MPIVLTDKGQVQVIRSSLSGRYLLKCWDEDGQTTLAFSCTVFAELAGQIQAVLKEEWPKDSPGKENADEP